MERAKKPDRRPLLPFWGQTTTKRVPDGKGQDLVRSDFAQARAMQPDRASVGRNARSLRRRDPSEQGERRSAERRSSPVSSRVHFTAGQVEGDGETLNISASGVLVVEASHVLEVGTEVDLYFLQPRTELHAVGSVVRKAESGFAVRFSRLDRELMRLVLAPGKKAKTSTEE